MNPASLATALVGAQTGLLQLAVAARLERGNADAASSVVKLIDAAQASANSLANAAAGTGGNIDVTALSKQIPANSASFGLTPIFRKSASRCYTLSLIRSVIRFC